MTWLRIVTGMGMLSFATSILLLGLFWPPMPEHWQFVYYSAAGAMSLLSALVLLEYRTPGEKEVAQRPKGGGGTPGPKEK